MVLFAEFDRKYHMVLNIKSEEWDLKILLFLYFNDLGLGPVETPFFEGRSYVSLNEPPQVSKRLVFAEFNWKFHIF